MKLSIVVPLLNERESLPHLTKAIADVLIKENIAYEIIFVDDGSTDGSFEVIRDLKTKDPERIKGYRFCRNYGKSAALSVGIAQAQGDVIVTMDADLQDDPVAIPEMLKQLDEGYDVVSGWKKVRHDPLSKTFPSKIWNAMTASISGVKLHDFNCGFKAYRNVAAKSLEIYGERHRYLPALAHWDGFRVTEVVVPHHARQYGKSKYGSFLRIFNGLFDLLTLLFLRRYLRNPLHFFGLMGFTLLFLGTVVLGYFGVSWIITQELHIRPLLLLSVGAIIMGIQFVSFGFLAEMLTNLAPKDTYKLREKIE